MDITSILSDKLSDKVSDVPLRRREAFKERCKWLAKDAHKSPRWLAENFNIILDRHLNKENIQKLSHRELLVFGGSTTRAVSGSVFGVVISSGLTTGCPLFAVSVGFNTWQLCISSQNLSRVRKEIKRRRLVDESFRNDEEDYKKKKRHHPVVDVVVGCTLKAAFMTATMGIIGFSNIADSFASSFGEKVVGLGTEFVATSAAQTCPVDSHITPTSQYPELQFPNLMEACQDTIGTGTLCPTTTTIVDTLVNTLAADCPADYPATIQATTAIIDQPEAPATAHFEPSHGTDSSTTASAATQKPIPSGLLENISRPEQFQIDHPTISKVDNAVNGALVPGSLMGQKLSQHLVDNSVKIGMEVSLDDLRELRDDWEIPVAKILGLVVMIVLLNEVFQPIPHVAGLVAERAIDAWNSGQLTLTSTWLTHIVARLKTYSSSTNDGGFNYEQEEGGYTR
ncbi:hypothetical protein CCHR01_18509 [Colletotrichum chrysophilum]|uniref:Uncharacterized protein n=1 Tax=Colletotrichum chrysophilum TaxID=1836956 RepID=A0AAD9EBE3_9PEZI|nr:hypothetical protein CCHR01_18509 [Colletotrichum chrysophilum]